MEAPDLFHAGFCRAGAAHCGPEKVGGGGEQFVVEDLLDFSNEEEAAGWGAAAEEEGGSDGAAENLTGSSTVKATDSCCNSLSACDREAVFRRSMADAGLPDDFCEPQYDAMAELTKLEFEWAMSDVSEDSFSSKDLHKLHLISGVNSTASSSSSCTATATALAAACQADQVSTFRPEAPVPGKARSKRSRGAPGNWSSRLLVLSHSAAEAGPSQDSELIAPPAAVASKKPQKKESAGVVTTANNGRRCLHCQTNKTPQWRTGPMGPKTLCNACGVRFKSGRLVPEYRPAASPNFVVSQHSNSHRKVLELRSQKELQQQLAAPTSALYDPPPASLPGGFLIHDPDIRYLI
ncbi:GATA transcription factor 9-like [Zingiber officinale]|nr:GATA transcription factor 9-like [Zingiber officinale]